jgi:hypothetical protein
MDQFVYEAPAVVASFAAADILGSAEGLIAGGSCLLPEAR